MPCLDTREDDIRLERKDLTARLNAATKAACEAFKLLEGKQDKLSNESYLWWRKHQIDDNFREKIEELERQKKLLLEQEL